MWDCYHELDWLSVLLPDSCTEGGNHHTWQIRELNPRAVILQLNKAPTWWPLAGKFVSIIARSSTGNTLSSWGYLHSALVNQNHGLYGDFRIAESGELHCMTHRNANIYGVNSPPPLHESITIGDWDRLKVEYIGSIRLVVHRNADDKIAVADVSCVPPLDFD